MPHRDWTARILSCLLGEEDANALLGDLSEEYESRSSFMGCREAGRCYRSEVRRSLGATLRLRVVELLRSAPWSIVFGSYVVVGVLQLTLTQLLSPIWPDVAQTTSALSILVVSPLVAFVGYVAARFDRAAPFFLGALMFTVAALLIAVTTEAISTAYMLTSLTIGPLAAMLGGSLYRGRRTT